MKKIVLAAAGLVALSIAPAFGADLAARPYTKAPPIVAPIYNWGGFYIGLNGGGGSSQKCWDINNALGVTVASTAEGCHGVRRKTSSRRSAAIRENSWSPC